MSVILGKYVSDGLVYWASDLESVALLVCSGCINITIHNLSLGAAPVCDGLSLLQGCDL